MHHHASPDQVLIAALAHSARCTRRLTDVIARALAHVHRYPMDSQMYPDMPGQYYSGGDELGFMGPGMHPMDGDDQLAEHFAALGLPRDGGGGGLGGATGAAGGWGGEPGGPHGGRGMAHHGGGGRGFSGRSGGGYGKGGPNGGDGGSGGGGRGRGRGRGGGYGKGGPNGGDGGHGGGWGGGRHWQQGQEYGYGQEGMSDSGYGGGKGGRGGYGKGGHHGKGGGWNGGWSADGAMMGGGGFDPRQRDDERERERARNGVRGLRTGTYGFGAGNHGDGVVSHSAEIRRLMETINPEHFDAKPRAARFFVIKSYARMHPLTACCAACATARATARATTTPYRPCPWHTPPHAHPP